MEESKAGVPRRRRIASIPCLESLEGRRLLAANASQGSVRELTSNGVTELVLTGTSRADVFDIADDGTGAAGNVTVSFGDGSTYTSQGAISVIAVQSKGGADQVSYQLTGALVASRSVLVDLGAGNDQFTAQWNEAINNPAGLDLEAYGNTGNDRLAVGQSGPTLAGTFLSYLDGGAGSDTMAFNSTGDVAAGSTVIPGLSGGAGNDTITSDYAGDLDGNYIYSLAIDGGAGNDNITQTIHLGAGSSGTVGSNADTPAVVAGGGGNDQIRFAIAVDPAATQARVYATASGDSGKDTVQRTSNVQAHKSVEEDSVIA